MKIEIALNKKSIQNAINKIQSIKPMLPKMIKELMLYIADWIIDKANIYIDLSDIGSNVKEQIKSSWIIEPTGNNIKITNTSQKAVFVEFGVGIVGQGQPHPNASSEGYEYNVDSYYKDDKGSGTWIFQSNLRDLDIPQDKADFIIDDGTYVVITKGTEGVWFAYNAIVDAKMELEKANGGEFGIEWKKIKERYIR